MLLMRSLFGTRRPTVGPSWPTQIHVNCDAHPPSAIAHNGYRNTKHKKQNRLSISAEISSPMSRTRVHRTTAKLAAILLTVCTVISISAVDAFWGKSVISRHPRLSTDRMIPALLVRGGSESASAWNAGSRYDYRSPKSSLLNRSKPIRQQSYDIREDTKEAIATAFLNRDDRNRFIGKSTVDTFIYFLIT